MQQMDQSSQQETYGRYEGESQYYQQIPDGPGQKLSFDEDEQFADVLVSKLKQELQPQLKQERGLTSNQRLFFSLMTIIAMALAFVFIAIAFMANIGIGAGIILVIGFIVFCGIMVPINAFVWGRDV